MCVLVCQYCALAWPLLPLERIWKNYKNLIAIVVVEIIYVTSILTILLPLFFSECANFYLLVLVY